jgi:hypothetical protein
MAFLLHIQFRNTTIEVPQTDRVYLAQGHLGKENIAT